MIKKYSVDFVAEIPSEGYYNDSGDWVLGSPKHYKLRGAILSHRELKVFRSEGTLTGQDRALFMLEPLENALQLAKIIHGGKEYSVGELLENSRFTGVWAYTLKYVSAFKGVAPDYNITEELDKLEDRLDGVLTKSAKPLPEPTVTDNLGALGKRLDGVDYD